MRSKSSIQPLQHQQNCAPLARQLHPNNHHQRSASTVYYPHHNDETLSPWGDIIAGLKKKHPTLHKCTFAGWNESIPPFSTAKRLASIKLPGTSPWPVMLNKSAALQRQEALLSLLPTRQARSLLLQDHQWQKYFEKAASARGPPDASGGRVFGEVQKSIPLAHRSNIVKWIGEACSASGWTLSSFFLAVDFFDRYIMSTRCRLAGSDLGAAATAALYTAAHITESSTDENIMALSKFRQLCPEIGTARSITEAQAHAIDCIPISALPKASFSPVDQLLVWFSIFKQVAASRKCLLITALWDSLREACLMDCIFDAVLEISIASYIDGYCLTLLGSGCHLIAAGLANCVWMFAQSCLSPSLGSSPLAIALQDRRNIDLGNLLTGSHVNSHAGSNMGSNMNSNVGSHMGSHMASHTGSQGGGGSASQSPSSRFSGHGGSVCGGFFEGGSLGVGSKNFSGEDCFLCCCICSDGRTTGTTTNNNTSTTGESFYCRGSANFEDTLCLISVVIKFVHLVLKYPGGFRCLYGLMKLLAPVTSRMMSAEIAARNQPVVARVTDGPRILGLSNKQMNPAGSRNIFNSLWRCHHPYLGKRQWRSSLGLNMPVDFQLIWSLFETNQKLTSDESPGILVVEEELAFLIESFSSLPSALKLLRPSPSSLRLQTQTETQPQALPSHQELQQRQEQQQLQQGQQQQQQQGHQEQFNNNENIGSFENNMTILRRKKNYGVRNPNNGILNNGILNNGILSNGIVSNGILVEQQPSEILYNNHLQTQYPTHHIYPTSTTHNNTIISYHNNHQNHHHQNHHHVRAHSDVWQSSTTTGGSSSSCPQGEKTIFRPQNDYDCYYCQQPIAVVTNLTNHTTSSTNQGPNR